MYAPASGKVVSVNTKLKDDPSLVNKSAMEDGWMAKMELSNLKELDSLMDKAAYDKHVKESKH